MSDPSGVTWHLKLQISQIWHSEETLLKKTSLPLWHFLALYFRNGIWTQFGSTDWPYRNWYCWKFRFLSQRNRLNLVFSAEKSWQPDAPSKLTKWHFKPRHRTCFSVSSGTMKRDASKHRDGPNASYSSTLSSGTCQPHCRPVSYIRFSSSLRCSGPWRQISSYL